MDEVDTLLLLFYWPLVRGVCPNYEVVMFQPQTRTTPDLGYVSDCYAAILIITAHPFTARQPMSAWGGIPAHAHTPYPLPTVVSPHRIIRPPRRHLSSVDTFDHILLPIWVRLIDIGPDVGTQLSLEFQIMFHLHDLIS